MNRSGQNNTTGTNVIVTEVSNMPLVDVHMHIQSNDIAPLPIMLGVLNMQASRLIYSIPVISDKLRKRMNFENLSYIQEKGGYPINLPNVKPANRTGLLVQDFSNGNLEIRVGNLLAEQNITAGISLAAITAAFAAAKPPVLLLLAALPTALVIAFNNFPKRRRMWLADLLADRLGCFLPYGKIARQNSFLIAGIYKNELLMESRLAFSSRIQSSGSVTVGDIATARRERYALISQRSDENGKHFYTVSRHYYGGRFFNIGFNLEKSVILGMELMYAHYWGAYGIPTYIPDGKGGHYSITNNLANHRERVFCSYDVPGETARRITGKRGTITSVGNSPVLSNVLLGKGEKYSHFLKPVPDSELYQYEDLLSYNEYALAAAVKWPLQFFPFFHLDPRRFFAPTDRISQYHDFYLCEGSDITKMEPGWIEANLNSDDSRWQYGMDFDSEVKNDLLRKEGGSWKKGLFWGVKMYAALGYPPYLFDTPNAKEPFRCLQPGDYQGLLDFYNFCAESEIPITCHGSPQGMNIADPVIYLKEYLKDHPETTKYGSIGEVNFPMDGRTFINGIGLVDSFSSPYSWRLVLERLAGQNQQKFTLCLAHFGGDRYFNGTFNAANDSKTPYRWLDEISKLVKEYAGIYTDLSCFTYKDFVNFPSVISTTLASAIERKMSDDIVRHVFVPSSVGCTLNDRFINGNHNDKDWARISRLRIELVMASTEKIDERSDRYRYIELECYRELGHTAKTLGRLIRENRGLQHRVMFGTDWPMTEISVKGASRYSSAMFVLLQVLTDELGNEWDAWHQFAVINPLRFLGLLKDEPAWSTDGNTRDSHKLDLTKISAMEEAIRDHIHGFTQHVDFLRSIEFRESYTLIASRAASAMDVQYAKLKDMYSNTIPAAHKMERNGIMLLTNAEQGARGAR